MQQKLTTWGLGGRVLGTRQAISHCPGPPGLPKHTWLFYFPGSWIHERSPKEGSKGRWHLLWQSPEVRSSGSARTCGIGDNTSTPAGSMEKDLGVGAVAGVRVGASGWECVLRQAYPYLSALQPHVLEVIVHLPITPKACEEAPVRWDTHCEGAWPTSPSHPGDLQI